MKEQNNEVMSSLQDLFLHTGHTWVNLVSLKELKVGIGGFPLRLMGEIEDLIVPKVGDVLQQGSKIFGLKRRNRVVNLASPVTGKVIGVNHDVISDKEGLASLKNNAFSTWILKIEPHRLGDDLKAMRVGEDSIAWLKEEEQKAASFFLERLGLVYLGALGLSLGDGGSLSEGILDQLGDRNWQEFCRKFLGLSGWIFK